MPVALRVFQPDDKPPKRKPRRLPTFLRKHELEALLSAADLLIERSGRGVKARSQRLSCCLHVHTYAMQDRLLVILGGFHGLRVMESTGLCVEHVNLESRELFIKGKGGHERLVPIHSRFVGEVAEWCRCRKSGLLIHSKAGRKMTTGTVNYRLRNLAALAALTLKRRMHSHALRHTAASCILNAGGDLMDIKELLGHRSLQSTEKYLHCTTAKTRAALERI